MYSLKMDLLCASAKGLLEPGFEDATYSINYDVQRADLFEQYKMLDCIHFLPYKYVSHPKIYAHETPNTPEPVVTRGRAYYHDPE